MNIMRIDNTHYSNTFGIKFVENNEFKQLKEFVNNNKDYNKNFNIALENLEKADDVNVTINNVYKNGKLKCSQFICGNTSVENTPYDGESVVMTTYKSIIDLSFLNDRYRALLDKSTRWF